MKYWIPLVLALGLGCAAPKARYDWEGYDDHLYALMKDPGGLEAYGKALKKQVDRHPDNKRLPPGIHAEYGYVLYTTGHKPEAVAQFTREKALWPESAQIMNRMIENCAPKVAETAPVKRIEAIPEPDVPATSTPVAEPSGDPAQGLEAK